MGVFYTESPASRALCAKSRAETFELLVLNTSIIRPASNRYIRTYLERLHGAPYEPLHPVLRDTLAETFGVMVYQEDVVNVCAAFAGMPLATADGLRKSLSKKRPAKQLAGYAEEFFAGALALGRDPETIKRVWAMIMSFAGYSFCKGHSACYIQVAQHSCYLRAHYPAEFMAAVLANGGGFYHPFAYVAEAMRMGLTVQPPDVNASEFRCTGRGREVRIGLQFVKGLSADGAERLSGQAGGRRQASGSAENELSSCARVLSPPSSTSEPAPASRRRPARAHQGRRARLDRRRLDPADDAVDDGRGAAGRRGSGQRNGQRTASASPERPTRSALPGCADWFDSSPPPSRSSRSTPPSGGGGRSMRRWDSSPTPTRCGSTPTGWRASVSAAAPSCPGTSAAMCMLAGMLTTAKPVHTLKDEPMEFATFDDGEGLIETVLFPRVYRERGHVLFDQGPFIFRGKVEEEFGAITVTITHLDRLERAAGR